MYDEVFQYVDFQFVDRSEEELFAAVPDNVEFEKMLKIDGLVEQMTFHDGNYDDAAKLAMQIRDRIDKIEHVVARIIMFSYLMYRQNKAELDYDGELWLEQVIEAERLENQYLATYLKKILIKIDLDCREMKFWQMDFSLYEDDNDE